MRGLPAPDHRAYYCITTVATNAAWKTCRFVLQSSTATKATAAYSDWFTGKLQLEKLQQGVVGNTLNITSTSVNSAQAKICS